MGSAGLGSRLWCWVQISFVDLHVLGARSFSQTCRCQGHINQKAWKSSRLCFAALAKASIANTSTVPRHSAPQGPVEQERRNRNSRPSFLQVIHETPSAESQCSPAHGSVTIKWLLWQGSIEFPGNPCSCSIHLLKTECLDLPFLYFTEIPDFMGLTPTPDLSQKSDLKVC